MTAAEIATALGAAHRSGQWWRCLCPVHGSRTGRSATLALRDGERGLIVKCWAGCDPRDVLAELRQRGLLQNYHHDANPTPVTVGGDDRADTAQRIAVARRIWDAASDARGSPVAHYLASRGIIIPLPPSLRWAPSLRHPSGIYLPAMVARVENVDGQLIAVHRTFLRSDGSGKANVEPQKAMLAPVAGGAVKLAPAAGTLLIGEGIENCLAAIQADGRPAWAALSTSGMITLALPPIVQHVIILADHDRNGAGARAARIAAHRWFAEGRRVRLAMPPDPGTDFADVLAGGG
jgi:hypothetical protein